MRNPWLSALFQFHRADTFRALWPTLVVFGLVTGLIAWLEMDCLCLAQAHPLKNVTLMHSLLGFAISMLLVFRTNTAYDRWWEGRRLWGGLVTTSRNLALKIRTFSSPDDQALHQQLGDLIRRYPPAVKARLELSDPSLRPHQPLQLAIELSQAIQQACQQGRLPEARLFLLTQEVNGLVEMCSACERIRQTPIPLAYYLFIKKFIAAYTLTLPLGFAFSLGWLAVPIVVFIFYVLASLELIAEQMENPFGSDPTDLPLEDICRQIACDVQEVLLSGD